MSGNRIGRVAVAILAGIAVLGLSTLLSGLLEGILAQVAVHLLMLALSLLAMWLLGRGQFAEYGFQKARNVKWMRTVLIALALGALGSAVTLLGGGGGISMVQDLSIVQIILLVWVLASISEETLTRGLIQGCLAPLSQDKVNLGTFQPNLPTLIAALFFSAMHLRLLFAGTDPLTVTAVVIATFLLGLLAGHSRAESGSLVPAIAAHMLFNVGGVIGGTIVAILTAVVTGAPPGS